MLLAGSRLLLTILRSGCMHSSPLILGNDIRYMSDEVFAIITNRDLIALDQDPLGHTAEVVRQTAGTRRVQVFSKRLADPRSPRAIAYFNRGNMTEHMEVQRSDLQLTPAEMMRCTCAGLRDLETNTSVSKAGCMNPEKLHALSVLPHQAVIYLVTCYGTTDAAIKSDDDSAAPAEGTTWSARAVTFWYGSSESDVAVCWQRGPPQRRPSRL